MKRIMKVAAKNKKVQIRADEAKFRELMLLIARKSEGDFRFGALKLNKILFYADFLAYLKLGKPITGQEYFALPQGPAPKYLVPIRNKMVRDGEIAIRKRETYTGIQDRTFALREADVTKFSQRELGLIFEVIDSCRWKSAKRLSELTHKFAGWTLAKEKETIPYSVALVGKRAPTHDEIKSARGLESVAAACLGRYAAAAV